MKTHAALFEGPHREKLCQTPLFFAEDFCKAKQKNLKIISV